MPRAERALEWLERHSSAARSRHASGIFLRGRSDVADRLVSAVYFAAAAGRWAGYEDADHHLAAFEAGLAHCPTPGTVLDLGTGSGGAAASAARRWPTAGVVGLDSSRRMLRLARARHRLPNLDFRRGSVLALPWPDASFDLVTCHNAVPEPGELHRVLAPGGRALMTATTVPLRKEDHEWVRRWVDCGFTRVGGGDVEGGSWELYALRPPRP